MDKENQIHRCGEISSKKLSIFFGKIERRERYAVSE
jgi:hypothetical protein